jgi:hypothetical protein
MMLRSTSIRHNPESGLYGRSKIPTAAGQLTNLLKHTFAFDYHMPTHMSQLQLLEHQDSNMTYQLTSQPQVSKHVPALTAGVGFSERGHQGA